MKFIFIYAIMDFFSEIVAYGPGHLIRLEILDAKANLHLLVLLKNGELGVLLLGASARPRTFFRIPP